MSKTQSTITPVEFPQQDGSTQTVLFQTIGGTEWRANTNTYLVKANGRAWVVIRKLNADEAHGAWMAYTKANG